MRTYCNSIRTGWGDLCEKIEPSTTWGGEGYCKRPSGDRTDHLGQGRCKWHGGSSPIKTGLYSKVIRSDMAELITLFENQEDPWDLTSEISTARAFLTKFVNEYDDIVEALLTWWMLYDAETEGNVGKPPIPPSEKAVIGMLDTISKIVKRSQEIKSDHTVTRKDLFRILGEMGRVVEAEVDPETFERIKKIWLTIKLA